MFAVTVNANARQETAIDPPTSKQKRRKEGLASAVLERSRNDDSLRDNIRA
jgi:hypothetical protein